MRKLIIIMLVIAGLFSCSKKDTYGYNCRCKHAVTGVSDTIYPINVQTSGEASYRCKDYADTANAYGKNIICNID